MTDTTRRGVEVQHLDPRSLLVDVNVRRDAQVDKEFVASVRDLGVLVPIVAVRTGDGAVRVRFGHRGRPTRPTCARMACAWWSAPATSPCCACSPTLRAAP